MSPHRSPKRSSRSSSKRRLASISEERACQFVIVGEGAEGLVRSVNRDSVTLGNNVLFNTAFQPFEQAQSTSQSVNQSSKQEDSYTFQYGPVIVHGEGVHEMEDVMYDNSISLEFSDDDDSDDEDLSQVLYTYSQQPIGRAHSLPNQQPIHQASGQSINQSSQHFIPPYPLYFTAEFHAFCDWMKLHCPWTPDLRTSIALSCSHIALNHDSNVMSSAF